MTVYAYSHLPAFNPNTNPTSVAKSATGSVYDINDTGFLTPLNLTLVATNTVTTTLVSDSLGMFPDFTLVDRTQCVFKSGTIPFILTTTTPIPGPTGAASTVPGPPGPPTTDASLLTAGTVDDARLPSRLLDAQLSATYATADWPAGIVGTKRFDPSRSLYNGSALRKFSASIQRANNGGAAARIALLADSIGQGVNAAAPFNVHAWLYRLNAELATRFGDAGLGIDPLIDTAGQDTRYTTAGTWGRESGAVGFVTSGSSQTTTASGATLTYASPTRALTGIKVFYRVSSDGGSFTYAIDGGAASAPVSTVGAEAIASVTIPLTGIGAHSVVLTNGGATRLTVIAIEELMNSGNGGVKVGKFAQTGAVVGGFTYNAQPTSALGCLNVIGAPDLTIIALETNDYANLATPLAQYTASMQTLITNAKLTGDVLLIACPTPQRRRGPDGIGGNGDDIPLGTSPVLADYTQALYTLADTNGCAVLDLQHNWGPYATALANGVMSDDYHPSEIGHWAYAQAVSAAILPSGGASRASTALEQLWSKLQSFTRNLKAGTPGTNEIQLGDVNYADLTRGGLLTNSNGVDIWLNGQNTGTAMFYLRQIRKILLDPSTYFQGLNTATTPVAARALAGQTVPIVAAQDSAGAVLSSFDKAGRISTRAVTVPVLADLADGDVTLYTDGAGALKIAYRVAGVLTIKTVTAA